MNFDILSLRLYIRRHISISNDGCNVTSFDRLEKMYARAAIFIYGLNWSTEKSEVLLQAGWKSLDWHYKCRLVVLTRNCYTDSVPERVSSLFTRRNIKAYNLRGKNK